MRTKFLLAIVAGSIAISFPARAEPAMWVIRDKDSTIYLIGTLHLLRHGTEWNAARVEKLLDGSTELWLEVADPDNQAAALPLIQQYGFDPSKPLSSKLSAAQKAKLEKVAATYDLPVASLEPMKPWMAGLFFTVLPLLKAGFDPNAGVELFLKKEAEQKGEKIHGFETLEEQTRFLADLPQSDQIAFLEESLDDADKGLAELEKLADAWLHGDTKTIGTLLDDELKTKAPQIYEKLFVQRNIRWSQQIAHLLEGSGMQLIAVGAGHLAGPDSLQVQLAKRGIKVESY